jgi:uncharacterized protein YidB (DUF937 family)
MSKIILQFRLGLLSYQEANKRLAEYIPVAIDK